MHRPTRRVTTAATMKRRSVATPTITPAEAKEGPKQPDPQPEEKETGRTATLTQKGTRTKGGEATPVVSRPLVPRPAVNLLSMKKTTQR